jgi:hypothetical protein
MMAGSTGIPTVTPQAFAVALLRGLHDPTTPQNVSSLTAWEGKEGGNFNNGAKYNPLNTTQDEPGSQTFGSTGQGGQASIRVYNNWAQGLKGTEDTLNNGDYGDIEGALKQGHGLVGNLSGLGTWSDKGYYSIPPTNNVGNLGSALSTAKQTFGQGGTTYIKPATAQQPKPTVAGSQAQPVVQPTNNLGAALNTAFRTQYHQPNTGALASQLATALNARAATVHIGTTQQIPSQHIGTIAQLGDDPHNLALAGAMAVSHDPRLGEFNKIVTSADNVNKMNYNYEWGGGHNAAFQPSTGSGHGSGTGTGYDCSGVVSHILHMAGLLKSPLVASEFANLGAYVPQAKPGVGSGPHTITIYANADHTFANIGGTYFGTSSENQGGGAGWIGKTTENNNADFTAWHIDF